MVNPRDVPPTRAELLALRKRIILVEHGHRVLKMKQDVLLLGALPPDRRGPDASQGGL